MVAVPLTTIWPRPVSYASLIPSEPMIVAPVGKSGPWTRFMSWPVVASGSLSSRYIASQSSNRLWGGMFVAIPTAIPAAPLSSRFGSLAGRSTGSCRLASKLSTKSTVSSSRFASISSAAELRRASV